MAADAPTEGMTVPEPRIAGRRGLAFATDMALSAGISGAIITAITVRLPAVVIDLIQGAIAVGYWSSSAWLGGGRTPGMWMAGLEVREVSGTRAPQAAHIKRAAFLTLVYSPFALGLLDALTHAELSLRLFPIQVGVAFGYAGFAALELRAGGNAWLLHDRWSGAGVRRVGRAHVPPILPGPAAIRRALIAIVIATLPSLALVKLKEQGYTSSSTFRPTVIPSELAQVIESRLETDRGLRAKVSFGQETEWSAKSGRVAWLVMNVRVPSGAFSLDTTSLRQETQLTDSLIYQVVAEINQRHLDVHEFDGIKLTIGSPKSATLTSKVRFRRRTASRPPVPRDSL